MHSPMCKHIFCTVPPDMLRGRTAPHDAITARISGSKQIAAVT